MKKKERKAARDFILINTISILVCFLFVIWLLNQGGMARKVGIVEAIILTPILIHLIYTSVKLYKIRKELGLYN